MKGQEAVAVALVVVLTGCSSTVARWVKPAATADDFNRDSYDCARAHTGKEFRLQPLILGGPSYGDQLNKDLYRACLVSKGYQRVETESGNGWRGFD